METGKENPYSCVVLAGMKEQSERRANLEAFKEGDVRFLVCTDVAARGLDVAGLPYVIQTTLPDDTENYIHRIGRCGRAEHMGLAISIVATEREKVWYHKCPSKGKNCAPYPGNTKLTIPFGGDGKLKERDENKWCVNEGGCTIWYDEPDLISKIEKRIGQPMLVMDPDDFSVPGVLESPLGPEFAKKRKQSSAPKEPPSRRALKRKVEEKELVVYGAKKNDVSLALSAKHTSSLAPVVNELAALEREIQQIFATAMWSQPDSGTQALASTRSTPTEVSTASAQRTKTVPAEVPAPALTSRQEPATDFVQTSAPAAGGDRPKTATGWASGGTKSKRSRW